jgi:hypothetical protein
MSAVMDLGNATKGAIAFSRITIWGGVKASGCREIATPTWPGWLRRPVVGRRYRRRCRDGQARPSIDGSQTQAGSKGLIALPVKLPHHPVVPEEQAQRATDIQLRIADRITAFAGSMNFVYLHVALFAIWMLFLEKSPWPQHRADPADPPAHDRTAQTAHRPPQPAGEVTMEGHVMGDRRQRVRIAASCPGIQLLDLRVGT